MKIKDLLSIMKKSAKMKIIMKQNLLFLMEKTLKIIFQKITKIIYPKRNFNQKIQIIKII